MTRTTRTPLRYNMAAQFKAAQHHNNSRTSLIYRNDNMVTIRSSRRRAYPKQVECRPRFSAVTAGGDGAAVRYLVRGDASGAHRLRFATQQYKSTKTKRPYARDKPIVSACAGTGSDGNARALGAEGGAEMSAAWNSCIPLGHTHYTLSLQHFHISNSSTSQCYP